MKKEYFWLAKKFLSSIYDMNDLDDALYFAVIESRQDIGPKGV